MNASSPADATPPLQEAAPPTQRRFRRRISLRGYTELCIGLLVMVLLVRTFLLEAYLVPTGSMAPTLAGHHKATICPRCQQPVLVGHRGDRREEGVADAEAARCYQLACCPNCGWDRLGLDHVDECFGDRLLVQKHIYDFRAPRRWEMIVFRHPERKSAPQPETVVKRVVGLPGERVQIRDGEVFINDEIVQKPLPLIRTMRLLVFDNDRLPDDAPTPFRWHWEGAKHGVIESDGRTFHLKKSLPATDYHWLTYRHLRRHRESGNKPCWREDPLCDDIAYNGSPANELPVHDVILECQVRPLSAGWVALVITDGLDDVLIELPAGSQPGQASVRSALSWDEHRRPARESQSRDGPSRPDREGGLKQFPSRLTVGYSHQLELTLVDRQVFLTVDGQETLRVSLARGRTDGPRRALNRQLVLGGRGPVSIGGRGLEMHITGLRLYRDVHYGGEPGNPEYQHGVTDAAVLGADEFFVLGDNSSNSYDSRCWKSGPAVRRSWLVGKPLLVHLPSRVTHWRAFGMQWNWQTPDWSRVQWVR